MGKLRRKIACYAIAAVGVAEAFSKVKLPEIVMQGGGNSGSGSVADVVGMNMLWEMYQKVQKK